MPTHHTPLHLAAAEAVAARAGVAADRAQGRGPAARRARRSRRRLLRDRQGAAEEPRAGRRRRSPRRSQPTDAARERDRRRPVRELPRRSRATPSAGSSTRRCAASCVPARDRRRQDDLHRLLVAEHLQAPRLPPHPRHDDRPRARADLTARSATGSSASTSSATGAPRTACCSPPCDAVGRRPSRSTSPALNDALRAVPRRR